ncbi:MAG TPA: radical SAM protein, partial [Saprospiraceae bacterium]|nr:radical SAM protein [Saprospiraceae bacterium]
MSASKIILFNPRSARHKHRIPNSILQVGASIDGKYEYVFVDGNMEKDPWLAIRQYLDNGYNIFGCTAMPGPQLKQAIPYSKEIRELYPHVRIIWGGYFAANQFKSVINSGFVDYIINGPGDEAFPLLLEAIEKHEESVDTIQNLIYKKDEKITKTSQAPLLDQDKLPALPYEYLNRFYPLKQYFGKTF